MDHDEQQRVDELHARLASLTESLVAQEASVRARNFGSRWRVDIETAAIESYERTSLVQVVGAQHDIQDALARNESPQDIEARLRHWEQLHLDYCEAACLAGIRRAVVLHAKCMEEVATLLEAPVDNAWRERAQEDANATILRRLVKWGGGDCDCDCDGCDCGEDDDV